MISEDKAKESTASCSTLQQTVENKEIQHNKISKSLICRQIKANGTFIAVMQIVGLAGEF